ncbi:MAG TPA: aminotransferase class III-fold pyridoxal phosphate-dependent enzyme, partial [Elusimicrobiales bacterium]|nr:aminotransferase class III-fold pyridoxal phosphate-dependent enzyme [Elusimicrobiales bacterium]
GVNIPPQGYLKEAEKLCKENNVLFVADEIQTGFGRTGKLFCCHHDGLKPDVLILGKALGGGVMPVSAVVSSKEILGVYTPGTHGSTFGGNPLACAVSRAAIRTLVEEKLTEKSAELGKYFMDKLKTIKNPLIKEIRGKGLFIGVELKPEAGGARKYCQTLKKEGMLCKETHENVIRFAPPLTIKKEELDWAFERIKKVLS